jgi:hypothetical protein
LHSQLSILKLTFKIIPYTFYIIKNSHNFNFPSIYHLLHYFRFDFHNILLFYFVTSWLFLYFNNLYFNTLICSLYEMKNKLKHIFFISVDISTHYNTQLYPQILSDFTHRFFFKRHPLHLSYPFKANYLRNFI